MPLYEFQCKECETRTEEIFSIAKRPDKVPCKSCGKSAEYVVSLVSYHQLNDPTLRKAALMKRSANETQRELKHTYDKFGFKAFGPKTFTGVGEGKVGKKKAKKKK